MVLMRLRSTVLALGLGLGLAATATAQATNRYYAANRPPLRQGRFVALPLGAIRPAGWLQAQLTIQANGLTGHLDEFWPDLRDSAWKGKDGEGWERGPYFLDGLVPLAWELDHPRLKAVAQSYVDWTLQSGQTNGWFGPTKNKDRWPLSVALKVLAQYHEATGDARALTLIANYFAYLKSAPPDWPDKEWRGVRAMETALTAYWLYNRTGDASAIPVAESIFRHSFDWSGYFLHFPYTEEVTRKGLTYTHLTHNVNIAMAFKHPGLWYLLAGEDRLRDAVYTGIRSLDEHHGQVGGRFSGDEHLAGRSPTQGSELCAIVEYMFSLEQLVEAFGDAALADRLELLAYNAYPGALTPDCWAHQYDQQANQVLVSKAKRKWSTNDDTSNLYGLEPNFGCCTANLHQGWPKLVSHLWMATPDNGLAAIAYGPCRVRAKVAQGIEATVNVDTDYPFDGTVRMTVYPATTASFPLHFRIPNWAEGATLRAGGMKYKVRVGSFAVVERTWRQGDVVELQLPMRVRAERRYNQAVSLLRGPLVYALKIGEQYQKLKSYHPTLPVADWEITPTTPWNYGLVLDPTRPEDFTTVEVRKLGKVPFAQETAPISLRLRGRQLPEWQLADNSAGETPVSPARSAQPVTEVELIPYGCTRLRISEFPVIDMATSN